VRAWPFTPLGHDTSGEVAFKVDLGVRIADLDDLTSGVVGESGGSAVVVLHAYDAAEQVALVRQGLSGRVGSAGQAAECVVFVGQGAAVEVRLGCQTAGCVVLVAPLLPLGIRDCGQPEFGVVGEPVVATVGGAGGLTLVEVRGRV